MNSRVTNTPPAVLYQQRITTIVAIVLADERQVVDARQVCVLPSCPSCGLSFAALSSPSTPLDVPHRSSPSFFPPRFCLTERSERSPRELVYFPIERRSTERARDGYLRRAGQTDRPDVIESRYFIVSAPSNYVSLRSSREPGTLCVPRRVRAPDDWKIICRVTCGYCEKYSFSYWLGLPAKSQAEGEERERETLSFDLSLRALFERTRDRISFESDEAKVYKRYD